MANEVRIARQVSGLTLYFAVRNALGQVWDTAAVAFGAIGAVTWTNADIALTEQGTTGDYYGNFPAVSAGIYTVEIFEQVGATPVRKDDTLLASTPMIWRGSRLLSVTEALGELVEDDTGVFRFTTNSLELAPTGGSAAAIWEALVASHSGVAGSFAERLSRIPNAAAGGNGGLPTVNASNYVAGIAGTKNQLDDLQDVSAASVADAVLDEALSAHTGAGSLGERIGRIPNAAAGGLGGLPTADSGGRVAANVTQINGDQTAAASLGVDYSTSVGVYTKNKPHVLVEAAIVSLSSQTVFTLQDGSTDDDAYNGLLVRISDNVNPTQQHCVRRVVDYVGSTRTLTIESPPPFTIASSDRVAVVAGDPEVPAIKTAADAIKAKTDNLPADPAGVSDIPLATENATAVRTELATELGRLDAAVSSRLAAADVPTNFSSLVITAGGAVDSLVQGILDTLFTETTAGRIAGNFDTFFENADQATANTVDDVGSGSGGSSAAEIVDALLDELLAGHTVVGSVGERLGRLPNAAAGGAGGLPTVDASNFIAGIAGTKNQLDDLQDLSAAAAADAVWDEARAGHNTAGSFGETLGTVEANIHNLDAAVSTRLDAGDLPTNFAALVISGAGAVDSLVQGFVDTAITESSAGRIANNFDLFWDNANAQTANTVDDVGGSGGSTAGEIVDALLDELLSGHTVVGSVGERLGRIPNAAAGGAGGLPTVDASNFIAGIAGTKNQLDDLQDLSAAEAADAVWDEARAGHVAAGSFGETLGTVESNIDNLDAAVSSRLAALAVPANFTALSITAGGQVGANLQAILGTALVESSVGRIAGNFDGFWNNSDAPSAKVLDDVGTASGIPDVDIAQFARPLDDRWVYRLGPRAQGSTARNPIYLKAGASQVVAMDFSEWAKGDVLDQVVLVQEDPESGDVTVAEGIIVNNTVRCRVTPTVNGVDYLIRFRASSEGGNTYDALGELRVRAD